MIKKMEERMLKWEKESKVGEIMKKLEKLMKLYKEYVKNFEKDMDIINYVEEKYKRFMEIMDEINRMKECGKIKLKNKMVRKVKRINN